MRCLFAVMLVTLTATLSGPALADDTDAIRTEMTKAKKAHADADAKAKAALLSAIDDAIKAVAGTGDLDGVKTLQAAKKVFEDGGKVPDSARLRTASAEYLRATKAAQATLEKAYDKAVKDATKGLNIDLAEAIQAEWKEFRGKGATAPPKKIEAPGTKPKWIVGTFKVTNCPDRSVRTYIISSTGEVTFPEEKLRGQLKPHTAGSFTLDFGEGKLQRVTFADGRLFTEHFDPKSNFEKNLPAQIGIGEPVKKK